MSDYFASAFVRVKPIAPDFKVELRALIDKEIAKTGVFKISVRPQLEAFRKKIQLELTAKPFDVKVIPDVTTFRADLEKKLAGLSIPVKIVPVGGIPAAAAGAGAAGAAGAAAGEGAAAGGAAKLTEEEKTLLAVQKARTTAQGALISSARAYSTALGANLTAEERAAALTKAHSEAERGLTSASLAATNAEARRNAALEREATVEAERQAAIIAGAKADQDALATQLERITATQQADAALVRQAALTDATTAATEAADKALIVEVASLQKSSQVRALNNKLLSLERALRANVAEAEAIQNIAQEANNTLLADEAAVMQASNAATLEGVAAQQALTAARLEAIGPTNARIRQEAQLTKGLLASALAALGLRGAVLAASAPFLIGTVAAIGFFKAVQGAAQLQQQLNVFRITAGATADEMKRVRDEAVALGQDVKLPATSAADAATAMTELAKAGLSVEDSMNAARGVLELSTAANIDQAASADLVADALNAFGLSGTEAVHVADLLANASDEAQGGITDMGEALKNVAPVARLVGLEVDQTVAFVTLLAKSGRQGAEAGTTLRNAFLRLLNPSEKAQKVLKSLRLESGQTVRVLDSAGRLNVNIFSQIEEATNRLSAAERKRDLGIIFGTRAIIAQGILGRESAAALQDQIEQVNQAGAAQELAGAQTAGFTGKVEALKNTLSTLGIQLGTVIIPALGILITSLEENLTVLSKTFGVIGDLTSKLQGPIGGFLDLTQSVGGFLDRATKGIPVLDGFFDPLSKSGADADKQIEKTSKKLAEILAQLEQSGGGPSAVNEAVVSMQKLVAELEKGSPAAQQLARDVQGIIEQLQAGANLPDLKIPVSLEAPTKQEIFADIQDQVSRLKDALSDTGDLAAAGLGGITQSSDDLDASLKKTVADVEKIVAVLPKGGGTAESFNTAADAVQRIADGLDKSNPKAKELQNILIGLIASLRAAAVGAPSVGDQIGSGLKSGFKTNLDAVSPTLSDIVNDTLNRLSADTADAANKTGQDIGANLASGISTALALAEASGDQAAQLALLRRKRARDEARKEALLRGAGLSPSATPEQVQAAIDAGKISKEQGAKIKAAAQAVKESDDQIDSILSEQASAAKSAAAKAKQHQQDIIEARNKHDKAILDSFDRDEAKATLNQAHIESTATLKDDIALSKTLIQLHRRQLAEARKRLQDTKTRAAEMAKLTREIRDEQAHLDDLVRQQKEAARAAAQQRNADRLESLALDVQIAETTGNKAKEEKALNAEIRELERQIRFQRAGSIARKRLILQLREAQKQLRELKEEKKKEKNEFRAMAFEFLTTQQGFAATLLGNLLPLGAVANTVGGTTAPATGLPPSTTPGAAPGSVNVPRGAAIATGPFGPIRDAAEKAAAGGKGPSFGQNQLIISILHQVVHQLILLNTRTKHPEAKHHQKASGSHMDVTVN